MSYHTTGSTELKAVNQILASVGQAPVTTLETEDTIVINKVEEFTGSISGTTLTTETADIPVGTFIGGTGVTAGTSTISAGTAQGTTPETYNYTLNLSQTVASSTLTQSKVTTRVEQQTNPDVAIALDTLREVSREVQSEGWTFNTEMHYEITPDSNDEILIPANVLQMDLNDDTANNIGLDAIFRGGKLYDKVNHSYKWTHGNVYVDILWHFDWENIPAPIQAYIVARAAAVVSSRIIGDTNQYSLLSAKEQTTRSQAMQYDCEQGDYSFFGSHRAGNFYTPYKPFRTLIR